MIQKEHKLRFELNGAIELIKKDLSEAINQKVLYDGKEVLNFNNKLLDIVNETPKDEYTLVKNYNPTLGREIYEIRKNDNHMKILMVDNEADARKELRDYVNGKREKVVQTVVMNYFVVPTQPEIKIFSDF